MATILFFISVVLAIAVLYEERILKNQKLEDSKQ